MTKREIDLIQDFLLEVSAPTSAPERLEVLTALDRAYCELHVEEYGIDS